ncbi:hypothetical protein SLEP1_g26583 [Rubroshorea leprosula]|uniref:Uncharacterized protein n=1 Tax=Rubroshorea leprosula TaxID=152421 RepID=A0AAV5JMB4_9ROSI|nr:hypothetical protein SLEP1_g26583 [Rubroshorea leprosula]
MAGEEQNTQQPTGGKGARFHAKKQIISKGELPKQEGAGGISFREDVKTINKPGPSVPSKKRNRGCPSSGLPEQDREIDDFTSFSMEMKPMVGCIEMDDSTSFSTEMKPMDDFIEMDDLTSFSIEMKPMDDFIEMDDFTSLRTEMMPMDDFIEMDDFTSFGTEKVQSEDFNDQSSLVNQYYSLNKLENKIIKLNKDHSN